MLLQILFPVLFQLQKFKLVNKVLTFILFVSAHLQSLCKSFCSICVSFSSFIPRRIWVSLASMILLSLIFCNLYQIYGFAIGGALTQTLGVCHF